MAQKRLTYLCVLAGVTAFYIAYQEWFSWVALLAVLGLPWLSLLVSLPGILSFRAMAEGPDAIVLGQQDTLRLTGTGNFPVPPFSGRLRVCRCTTGEQWISKKDFVFPADHCGGLRVIPEKVRVCDYLGLFRFRVRNAGEKLILVRPEPAQMETPPDLNRYLTRSWRPKPGGGYAENHELRLYRPGDSLNQIHWKLTAKTGKLTIREAMEPNRGLVLLTMDLKGSAPELDRKFGRLLWLGDFLLQHNIPFEIRVLTADGIQSCPVAAETDLKNGIDTLLCRGPVKDGSIQDVDMSASWKYHIGGGSDGP